MSSVAQLAMQLPGPAFAGQSRSLIYAGASFSCQAYLPASSSRHLPLCRNQNGGQIPKWSLSLKSVSAQAGNQFPSNQPAGTNRMTVRAGANQPDQFQPSAPPADAFQAEDPVEAARIAHASKRVDQTSRYFRRLGVIGFWIQLACSLVSAVILTFSIVITGKPTAPITTYLTSGGIVAGFLSVFWAFGYLRLSDRLKSAVSNPTKAPPRAVVVSNLKNGLIINLLGMAVTLIGLQATVGTLVAKALTSSTPIYGAGGLPSGYNPVLALDVFLVQASANAALSHFVGLILSLELLRSVTGSQPPPAKVIPVAS